MLLLLILIIHSFSFIHSFIHSGGLSRTSHLATQSVRHWWLGPTNWYKSSVYSRAPPYGFPQFVKKKCCMKFSLLRQNNHGKVLFFFQIKYLKTSLTTTLIFWPRSVNLLWTFIACYCLNCFSFLCLSHYFTLQTSGILQ